MGIHRCTTSSQTTNLVCTTSLLSYYLPCHTNFYLLPTKTNTTMSDIESEQSGSDHESDAAPDSPVQPEAETSSKEGGTTKRPTASHPTYLAMVMDAVQSQQVRGGGGSRAKIVQFIKSKYKLDDVKALPLKKAISKAIENEQLESKTGTGMNGTFVLSKSEKQKIVKEEQKKRREDEKAVKQAETKEA